MQLFDASLDSKPRVIDSYRARIMMEARNVTSTWLDFSHYLFPPLPQTYGRQ